jgi:chromosome segregation protein
MYLQKLEIQGFKSFANRTVLEFIKPSQERKGITAIVGPNGSGKSNIADAIRWVLGEQSLKLLRSKKSEDVIFFGSDKRARHGFAEVSLYLNNESKAMPVDWSEVVITRRLYRDGESEYLINKNKTRLSDIVLLLAEANFGQKSYSVIGQGMVDSILSLSPTERKAFFDEATQVSQFQIKKEQAKNKLLATQENLKQATILLEEIEPRLRSLTRQVKKLERKEEIEKELKNLQRQYYSYLWHTIEPKIIELKSKIKVMQSQEENVKKDLNEARTQLELLEKEETHTQIFKELQQEYEKLFEEKNGLKEREIVLRNQIELAKHTREKIPTIPISIITDEIRAIDQEQKLLLEKIKNRKISLDEVENILGQIAERLETLLKKITVEQQTSFAVDPKITSELEAVAHNIEKINRRLTEVQAKISSLSEKDEEEKKKFFELQRTFEKKQNELNELNLKINDLKIELAKDELRKENLEAEIKQELGDLNEVLSAKVSETFVPGEAFSTITKLKQQLAQIGGIDEDIQDEYKQTKERYEFLSTQCKDLREASKSLETVIEELESMIQKQFNSAFSQINKEFEKYFKILFGGGKAELVLQKEEQNNDNFGDEKNQNKEQVCGIEIYVTLPGKRAKNINILSGGEKTLVSIALICAIIASNPSPFVVLDEVDAALDESNSIRFANILESLSSKTQFIVITHNRATMQKANILYGITMQDGVSKVLSLNLKEAEKELVNQT